MQDRPALLLVANAIAPHSASEPGKGYAWARAFSAIYDLHVITGPAGAQALAGDSLLEGWTVHPVGEDLDLSSRRSFYREYGRWCGEVIPACRAVLRGHPSIVGLHHITIGSFRVLPRYDQLGLPYTVGPLGGGEGAPARLLVQLGLPWRTLAAEIARLPANALVRLQPTNRRVLGGSALALATTPETAGVLAAAGARDTAVVYPDALAETGDDAAEVLAARAAQAPTLKGEFRCVFSGRAVWWKGPHLAIRLVHRLRATGVPATLTFCSEGEALPGLKQLAARLNLGGHVRFPGFASRAGLVQAYRDNHLFVLPSLHESSSSALLEGYSTGLPSMTLGLGGTATVAAPGTGFNAPVRELEEWLAAGCRDIADWVADPARWHAACRAAKARADALRSHHLEEAIRRLLPPSRYGAAQAVQP